MLCYAPPQIVQLPLKIFSPFLTEMAKDARTAQTQIRSPPAAAAATPSSCHQSKMGVQ